MAVMRVITVAVLSLAAWVALAIGAVPVFAQTGSDAPPAGEQAPPPPPPPQLTPAQRDAEDHFKNGIALYTDHNYTAALAEYEQAYKLDPFPGYLYNIGITQKELFRYAEAIDTLQKYLALYAKITPEQQAEARDKIREMTKLLADVSVEITPAEAARGASLTVDGRPYDAIPRGRCGSPPAITPSR